MGHNDKKHILVQFESKMNRESEKSQGLFSYHSGNEPVMDTLTDDYILQVRKKLRQYISPKDGAEFQWTERNGYHHFDFVCEDIPHTYFYYFGGSTIIMGLYLDGHICHTAEFELHTTPAKVLELYAEMWLLQYLKDEESELAEMNQSGNNQIQ